jgi:outer membrane scaffolding protein for murein synthesis (MipA/OmpV family)
MRIRHGFLFVLLLLVLFLPKSAIGEEKPKWELGVGVAFLQIPDYRGSDENRLYVLPYPYLIYRGDILKVEDRRISGQIFKTDRILLDFSGNGSVPVKSSHNTAREGMPDLDPTFELGPALNVKVWEDKPDQIKLSLFLPVRAVFSTDFSSVRREGWVFSPRFVFEKGDIIPQTGLNLGISAGPMFADSAYHEYYYTVDPVYANASRPAYSAGGGYSGTTLTIGLSKSYKQLSFNAFVSADFLQNSVFEDSPLVKRKISIMSGFNVSWIFLKSTKSVETGK